MPEPIIWVPVLLFAAIWYVDLSEPRWGRVPLPRWQRLTASLMMGIATLIFVAAIASALTAPWTADDLRWYR